jgi:hypothetical protein
MLETTKRRSRLLRRAGVMLVAVSALVVTTGGTSAEARPGVRVTELATVVSGPCADGICSTGSTVGPDGALYVTDGTAGRVRRVDRRTGAVTTFADGLPKAIPGVVGGGITDVAFRGRTAYVLVTGVSAFWTDLVPTSQAPAPEGVYRLDRVGSGSTRWTLVADLYSWSEQHPPANAADFVFIPGGFTYAMESYRDGFLVTDAHHNRVLRVRLDGRISAFADLGRDVVPTGLERDGRSVLVGLAGPVPHVADTGKVLAIRRAGAAPREVASGAPLLVDVEVSRGAGLYGLSQGFWPYAGQDGKEGYPAAADTGALMRADRHGTFRTVASRLDRPTTFELVGRSAYVVTLTGKVLKITGLHR